MLDEPILNHIFESAWLRMWTKFITFGSASTAVITILMIFRLMKFILDTIIHSYALHSMYGWSIRVLGACWNSLTHLLLHIARRPPAVGGSLESKSGPSTDSGEAPKSLAPTAPFGSPLPRRIDIDREINRSDEGIIGQNLPVKKRLYPLLEESVIPALPPKGENSRFAN